jgi:hypothetical protein
MKQTAVEFLEEIYLTTGIDRNFHFAKAKEIEKEQQGYSEEDMIEFAEFVATQPDKNRNVYGKMLHAKSKYDGAERTIDLLEQFKKK